MDHKTHWIERHLEIADKVSPVVAPEALMQRLAQIPALVSKTYERVPTKVIWLAAAALAALIAVNVFTASSTSTSAEVNTFADSYFSHAYTL